MENKPLLSICIPTYNRANVLRQSLEKMTSCSSFDERFEIIISDNGSIDNTKEIGLYFSSRFPNIKYYRNDQNIGVWNFSKVASYATGEYIRICNDYTYFDNIGLDLMFNKLNEYCLYDLVFFYDSLYELPDNDYIFEGLDQFLSLVSNRITWTPHFGCRKSVFLSLEHKDKECKSLFPQVDWSLRLVSKIGKGVIVAIETLRITKLDKPKDPYRYFHVFLDNYYSLIKPYVTKGQIQTKTLNEDKRKVLRYSLGLDMVNMVFMKNKRFVQDTSGAYFLLFSYFYKFPFFYAYSFYGVLMWVSIHIVGYEKTLVFQTKFSKLIHKIIK